MVDNIRFTTIETRIAQIAETGSDLAITKGDIGNLVIESDEALTKMQQQEDDVRIRMDASNGMWTQNIQAYNQTIE